MTDTEKTSRTRSVTVKDVALLAAVAVVYFITARLSLLLAPAGTNATPVWPPSGIGLAVMLLGGYRLGPAVFLGALFANILTLVGIGVDPAHSIAASLVTAAGNMLEGMAGVYLLRRFSGSDNPFGNILNLFRFIGLACLAATTVSATLGVLSFSFITGNWRMFQALWTTWWLGDAVGIVIVTPLIILVKKIRYTKVPMRSFMEIAAVFAVLVASTALVFRESYRLEFMIIPVLVWIAFRLGRLAAALSVFIVSGFAIIYTIIGAGPLSDRELSNSLLYLQAYIGVIAIVPLSISVLTHEQERSEKMRTAVLKQLYDIIDFLPDATFAVDRGGVVIAWNRAMEVLSGVSKDAIIGKGDFAYAVPFFGERRPILIDLLDVPSPELESKYKYVSRTGDILLAESYIPHLRGGLGAHLWGIAAPLFDQEERRIGAIEVIRDVTEQKHVEQALRESEIIHRTLFETAGDAIMLMQFDRYIDCNVRTLSLFGCGRDQIVGASLHDFSPAMQPDGRNSREKAVEKINLTLNEGPQFFEWDYCRKDGSTFTAEVSLNRMVIDGLVLLQAVVRDITERKRVDETLRRSEATVSGVFRAAPVGIGILQNRVQTSVNKYWCEMLGYPEESLIGKSTRILFESDEEWDRVGRILYERLQEKGVTSVETRMRRSDGVIREVILSAAPIRQNDASAGTIGIIHDVTERNEAARALLESERKYRELVEHANSIILRWTHDGRITFLNEFGQRFFGYTAQEIVGRHVVGTIVPSTDSEGQDLKPLMDRICADPAAFEQNVNENMRRSGERVWIAWTNKIVQDSRGNVVEILSVGTDVTGLKRAEDEIRELNFGLERRVEERTAELAVAKEQAEAADRIKSAFLATMSHELRTPLNSIIGFTGIILQGLAGPLNEEQGKQLGMVRSSAQHLLSLINDVLDISKIEAGQLQVHLEPFDVRSVMDRAVTAMKPLAEKKGLALTVSIVDTIGSAFGDRRRVEQVLLNLISNAVKFTDEGKVEVSVARIPDHPSGPSVQFRVADTGIGIHADDIKELFQPFRQIDTGLTRKSEGTGLGLAICRKLAELMDGEIFAESDPGRGSVFTFILPVKGAEAREQADLTH